MLNIDFIASHNVIKKVAASQKLAFSFSTLLLVTILRDNNLSIWTLLVMSSVILFYAKIPWKTYVTLLVAPIGFISLSIIAIMLSITISQPAPANAFVEFSLFSMHFFVLPHDLERATTIFFTAISATSCLYFLILTTPIYEISPVLATWKVPLIMIELIELMYRFIFLFLHTAAQLYTAQQARLGYRTFKSSFQSLSLLISSLFKAIFFRYQALSDAMKSRNIEQFIVPQYFSEKKQWDSILTLIALLFFIIAIILLQIEGEQNGMLLYF